MTQTSSGRHVAPHTTSATAVAECIARTEHADAPAFYAIETGRFFGRSRHAAIGVLYIEAGVAYFDSSN